MPYGRLYEYLPLGLKDHSGWMTQGPSTKNWRTVKIVSHDFWFVSSVSFHVPSKCFFSDDQAFATQKKSAAVGRLVKLTFKN